MKKETKTMSIKEYKTEALNNFVVNLYDLIVDYVKQKCPNGEYLDTQHKPIFADVLELGGALGEERISKYIYGLKIIKGRLYLATEYIKKEEDGKPIWTKEDFDNEENWCSLIKSTSIIILPTLCCIADNIED